MTGVKLGLTTPSPMPSTDKGALSASISYLDSACINAFFPVSVEAATSLLIGSGLKPAFALGSHTLVVLSIYDHKRCAIGAHKEAGLVIPVLPEGESLPLSNVLDLYLPINQRRIGFFPLDLPVTSENALSTGRELWGLPRFPAEITFASQRRQIHTQVRSDGETLFTLSGETLPGIPVIPVNLLIYTQVEHRLTKTKVRLKGFGKLYPAGTVRLTVGETDHPMTEHLTRLGLDEKSPALLMRAERLQMLMEPAVRIE
ncbi:acetoacetate decarboxylase family protein [Hahella aquimaris]|uniref:acetoacetate decarboxylase family protein n=1 Tax=Hahella sp. HNIBRBA332 TaxID=3015983 RepID=UPI00273A7F29|nr:acetoacetate decarboxylase family protein [Hahella sp. HNIBRBA332]WLQ12277.1 acetoacetate decarboxylase family protein [Hahella sp. HNIBRBA332]